MGRGDILLAERRMLLGARQDAARHDESNGAVIGQVTVGAEGEKQRRQFHLSKQMSLPFAQQFILENQLAYALLIVGSLDVTIG